MKRVPVIGEEEQVAVAEPPAAKAGRVLWVAKASPYYVAVIDVGEEILREDSKGRMRAIEERPYRALEFKDFIAWTDAEDTPRLRLTKGKPRYRYGVDFVEAEVLLGWFKTEPNRARGWLKEMEARANITKIHKHWNRYDFEAALRDKGSSLWKEPE